MIRVVSVRGLTSAADRAGVVYVGRAAGGWPAHPLANPFRPGPGLDPLTAYRAWVEDLDDGGRLGPLLDRLWAQTGGGARALGCWCVAAAAGDGAPVVCHAQVLAELLRERFGPPAGALGGIGNRPPGAGGPGGGLEAFDPVRAEPPHTVVVPGNAEVVCVSAD